MHTNRLAGEKSPYLLQHAHNPVDWYPWGEEAFEKSRMENKPIFLSIGYSTCHWCHVMERESFENEKIAELINREFVPIKVDREERPDVDRIYMTFVQATTGSGGWPMSVWLAPDRKPFFGGTYFPPENRYGHPGFSSILTQIAAAWKEKREQLEDSATEIVAQLKQQSAVDPGSGMTVDTRTLDSGFYAFRRSFDSQLGGFGGAPKFPRPSVFHFLLRYHARTQNQEALDMVLLTLREMAKGGMNDQLGGGFHRYSVDARWFVPHFEKMLYDQGQLVSAYLEAFQITGEAQYAETARRTLDYVLRDMTHAEGGFYSAEDADSVIDPEEPSLKGEGAFYVWAADDIRERVPGEAADWFCYRYGVAEGGNVADDPHHEFTNRNILYQAATIEETAEQFSKTVAEIRAGLSEAERILLAARAERVRPHLDDKILTAWNGLMISAFALAGATLDEPRYADAARRAAEFVIGRMYDPATGVLLRRFREGDAAIPGFLDDYAIFAQALLDLYETQFDLRHFELAVLLTEKQIALFEDHERGAFYSTEAHASDLVMRVKEDYDGAEPSGNSIALMNLLRLERFTNRSDFRDSAARALSAFAPRLAAGPVTLPQMLSAAEFRAGEPKEIVLAGERASEGMKSLLRVLHGKFAANRVVMVLDSDKEKAAFGVGNPAIQEMQSVGGRAAAYVCTNFTCQLPVTDPAALQALLG